MKLLAIIDVAADARMEAVRAQLADEIKGSWALFGSGDLIELRPFVNWSALFAG